MKLITMLACSSFGLLATARADVPPEPVDHWGDSPVADNSPLMPTSDPAQPSQPQTLQTPAPVPPVSTPPAPDDPSQAVPPPVSTPSATVTTAPLYYEAETGPAYPGAYTYAWSEPQLKTGIGVAIAIGGGLTGFTDRTMRDTVSSNVGGLWDFRASIGTHIPLGLDVTYLGTASNVNTFAGAPNGTLVGTTVEGALRWNMLPHYNLDPYLFAGIGWQRYDVTQRKFSQSDSGMKPTDTFGEFPLGAGLALRDPSGFTVDVRGTFRAAMDSTLVLVPGSTTTYANQNTWEASAGLGYEF